MKGFEQFFSPLRPLPTKRKTAPPWEGEKKKNNNSSSNGDPEGFSSADCPPQLPALVRPELAPTSDSSGGSVPPSPVREFRHNSRNLENNKELRRRLVARVSAGQPPVPQRAWQQHRQRDPPRRPWPARACLCRICSCLSILALLGVIIVLRLVASFTNEKHTLPAKITPVGDTGVHRAPPPPTSVPEREAAASIPGVQGHFRPNTEEKSGHASNTPTSLQAAKESTDHAHALLRHVDLARPPASVPEREASASVPDVQVNFRPNTEKSGHAVSLDTMPAWPVEAPVVSKTPTSLEAAKESADPVDAIPAPVGDTVVHLEPPPASVQEREAAASLPDVQANFRPNADEKSDHSVSIGDAGVHLAPSPASVPEREAAASIPDVKTNFRPSAEEKSGHPVSVDMMPAWPIGSLVVSKASTSLQATKESADPVDAITTPVGGTHVHLSPPPASGREQEASASLPGVHGNFQADAEEKRGHSVSRDMMPGRPLEAPVVSKTPTSLQAAKESADPADVEKESRDEQCWIFMHMERSGGAAVRQIATERWRKDELVYDTVQWRRGDTYAEDVMVSRWRLLHGGCVEAVRNDEARTCKWITIFRHPVSRLLSAYDYCQEAPRDPLCPPSKSADLETFAERWGNFALRQFALATVSPSTVKAWAARGRELPQGTSVWYLVQDYLTRGGVALEDAVLGEDVLEVVNKTLSTYTAVGIATELDATMRLFDKALPMEGLDWSSSLRKLRGQDYGKDAQYDNAASAKFQEAAANPRISSALRLDMLLFDHAVQVFQGQVAHYNI